MKGGKLTKDYALREKFSEIEMMKIYDVVRRDLPKLYVMPFFISIYQWYKHKYMVASTIVMLIFIFGFGWPLLSFFAPLLPIVLINIWSFIEANIITYKMNKVHNELIGDQIQIQWDELMDFVMIVISDRFLSSDNDDDNTLNTI
jgi:hypothetical protein